MLSRLPIRTLLVAAAALTVGFVGAFFALDLAGELAPAEPLVQIGAAYLTWVALALACYLLIRRFLPLARLPRRGADAADATLAAPIGESETPRETTPPHERETP